MNLFILILSLCAWGVSSQSAVYVFTTVQVYSTISTQGAATKSTVTASYVWANLVTILQTPATSLPNSVPSSMATTVKSTPPFSNTFMSTLTTIQTSSPQSVVTAATYTPPASLSSSSIHSSVVVPSTSTVPSPIVQPSTSVRPTSVTPPTTSIPPPCKSFTSKCTFCILTFIVSSSSSLPAPTDYAGTALYHHNIHRQNHSAPILTWNPDQANVAAQIASSCVFAHNM